jgi:hypothetical protein
MRRTSAAAGYLSATNATMNIVLADLELRGTPRKVLLTAPKNGFFYVIDRLTGELLSANNFVKVNWATHIDMETGRPVLHPEGMYWKAPPVTVSACGRRRRARPLPRHRSVTCRTAARGY